MTLDVLGVQQGEHGKNSTTNVLPKFKGPFPLATKASDATGATTTLVHTCTRHEWWRRCIFAFLVTVSHLIRLHGSFGFDIKEVHEFGESTRHYFVSTFTCMCTFTCTRLCVCVRSFLRIRIQSTVKYLVLEVGILVVHVGLVVQDGVVLNHIYKYFHRERYVDSRFRATHCLRVRVVRRKQCPGALAGYGVGSTRFLLLRRATARRKLVETYSFRRFCRKCERALKGSCGQNTS